MAEEEKRSEEDFILLPVKIPEDGRMKIIMARWYPMHSDFDFKHVYCSPEIMEDIRKWGEDEAT